MTNKYFVTANTHNIKEFVQPKNIKYVFIAESADQAPTCNLAYDADITSGFYQHVRFYKVNFDENGKPHTVEALDDGVKDFGLCPNGWFDFNGHLSKMGYSCWFLDDNGEYYFNDIKELYKNLDEWAKGIAEYKAKTAIIQAIEEEKEKLPW